MTPYFEQGGISIYHGDARELMPRIRGVVVTDPPYNVNCHYNHHRDDLRVEDYQDLLRRTCLTPCVVIHYPEQICALSWTLEEIPNKIVAWVYNANTPRQHRSIAWFGCEPDFNKDGQPYKNPTDKRIMKRIANGESARLYDWWEIQQVKNVSNEKTAHPCQIPEAVMGRIIRITDAETIIDPFLGSGTTLVAAKYQCRKAIGIEVDEKYCEIAAKRIQAIDSGQLDFTTKAD